MPTLFLLIVFCIFALPVVKLAVQIDKKQKRKEYRDQSWEKEYQHYNIDYSKSYQRKYLLSKFEYNEYKKLKEAADKKKYLICPKVRLLDLIEPHRNSPNYKTLLQKIQSKHVDFVVCDENLYVQAIIELDDSSHNSLERIERDKFVDTVLRSTGYTIVHVKSINHDILDFIEEVKRSEEYKNVYEQAKPTPPC